MKKTGPIYDFGVSHEDVLTEIEGVDLKPGDHLLCLASAGEIPLNIAALKHVNITAVDSSANQLYLCRLKLSAATFLRQGLASGFLGYDEMPGYLREQLFTRELSPYLDNDEFLFWSSRMSLIRSGVIHAGRFERFIRKAAGPALLIIGRKTLYRLFLCDTCEEQEEVFDQSIAKPLLRLIFRTAFHPRVYRNRSFSASAKNEQGPEPLDYFFFDRFRHFCCNTPARKNFLLQYVFLQHCMFPEALPEYLKPENHSAFLHNALSLKFIHSPLESMVRESAPGHFNKILLSYLSDWITSERMSRLLLEIQNKTRPGTRIQLRYIYNHPRIPAEAPALVADFEHGERLIRNDRFPFSRIVSIYHQDHPTSEK